MERPIELSKQESFDSIRNRDDSLFRNQLFRVEDDQKFRDACKKMSPSLKQADPFGKMPNTEYKAPKLNAMTLFAFRVVISILITFFRMMI